MTDGLSDEAASRVMIESLRDAAESRAMNDSPQSFVPDAAGGDPIPWCDNQQDEEGGRAAEHSRY